MTKPTIEERKTEYILSLVRKRQLSLPRSDSPSRLSVRQNHYRRGLGNRDNFRRPTFDG